MILIDDYFNNSDKLFEALKSKDFSHDRLKHKITKNGERSM